MIIAGILVYLNKDKMLGTSASQFSRNESSVCVIEENRGDSVPTDIALAVALNHVNKNNTPFNWVSVGYYPIYGSSNELNYYAFVFRKAEFSKFTTSDSLEQNASKYSDATQDERDKKYQFSDVASVLTGSAYGDSLIMRHFKGIPEFVGKKIEIKKYVENKYPDKTIGNVISDSPMGKMYFEIVNKSNNRATGEIIGLDFAVTSKSELESYQTEINNRKNRKYMSFDQKECESYKQALLEREKDLKNQWSK